MFLSMSPHVIFIIGYRKWEPVRHVKVCFKRDLQRTGTGCRGLQPTDKEIKKHSESKD